MILHKTYLAYTEKTEHRSYVAYLDLHYVLQETKYQEYNCKTIPIIKKSQYNEENTNKDLKGQTKPFSQLSEFLHSCIPQHLKLCLSTASTQIFVFKCLPNSKGTLDVKTLVFSLRKSV